MNILFTWPALFWGFLLLPVLILIYLLRRRFQPQTVSSLIFWEQVMRPDVKGAVVHRMPLPWIVALELLILSLLLIGATGPALLTEEQPPALFILDNSLSMQAQAGTHTALNLAQDQLAVLRKKQPGELLLAGDKIQMLSKPSEKITNEQLATLWNGQATQGDLTKAIAWARKNRPGSDIFLLTDQAPLVKAEKVHWLAFGEKADNLGFAGVFVSGDQRGARIVFEVKNYSKKPCKASILVTSEDKEVGRVTLTIEAGKSERGLFRVPPGLSELQLSLPEDALKVDNQAFAVVPRFRPLRVKLAISDTGLLNFWQRSLKAVSQVALCETNEDWLITDQMGENEAKPVLFLVKGKEPKALMGPFFSDRSHAICQGVVLPGLVWGAWGDGKSDGVALCSAGNLPLLTQKGENRLELNLIPLRSTLVQDPVWPALVWNMAMWAEQLRPGLRQFNYHQNELLKSRVPVGSQPILTDPSGSQVETAINAERLVASLDKSGLWHWREASKPDAAMAIAVNLLPGDESDLSNHLSMRRSAVAVNGRVLGRRELSWLFILPALLLLAGHVYLLRRG